MAYFSILAQSDVPIHIKKIRLEKKISQEDLAARLNVQGINIDRTMVSKIENEIREIYDFKIKAVAKALGINIETLFEET